MATDINNQIAITVGQAAKLLGVSPPTAYRMARMRGFPAFKLNGRVLVYKQGLEEWVRALAEANAEVVMEEEAGNGGSAVYDPE